MLVLPSAFFYILCLFLCVSVFLSLCLLLFLSLCFLSFISRSSCPLLAPSECMSRYEHLQCQLYLAYCPSPIPVAVRPLHRPVFFLCRYSRSVFSFRVFRLFLSVSLSCCVSHSQPIPRKLRPLSHFSVSHLLLCAAAALHSFTA